MKGDPRADELAALDHLHLRRADLLRRVREGARSAIPALRAIEDVIAEREAALARTRVPPSSSAESTKGGS
jgi:hypothetical protein